MFGHAAFSELPFSTTKDTETVSPDSMPIIFFNKDLLTFPLRINRLSNFDLKINTLKNYSLNINKINDFDLSINKLQNHDLKINTMTNFTTRR